MTNQNGVGWNLECSYADLPEAFYAWVSPTKVKRPEVVLVSARVAEKLGLNPQLLVDQDHAEIFGGNRLPPNSRPLAQAYAGHQFGGFSMLGDGRAILLGEQIAPNGQRFDVQLKGPGPTPYSRRGDGRASLGPMLREFIISHAMDALGVPTTLSLAVATTGEPVYRYGVEPGAVLTRVAASHIRVGTFQYAASRGNLDDLRALADYTIQRHYPHLVDAQEKYLELLRAVAQRQSSLVARWMSVGFIHGVMNTDNVSIAGETIDYGPCAFMNTFSQSTVFSSIDEQGRYAYGNQPAICQWNLARFAETLIPLLAVEFDEALAKATELIQAVPQTLDQFWLKEMCAKLGLQTVQDGDERLVQQLLTWMEDSQMDFTNTFRELSEENLTAAEYQSAPFIGWQKAWQQRLAEEGTTATQAKERMCNENPAVIARNHQVEFALAAAVEQGDFKPVEKLLDVLSNPMAVASENAEFRLPPVGGDANYQTFCGT